MKVYILHYDVEHNFGSVHGVFSSKEDAEIAREIEIIDWDGKDRADRWSIQEWDVQ